MVEYIDACGGSFKARRRHYALVKVLQFFLEFYHAGEVGEALDKGRKCGDLHKAFQTVISRLEAEGLKPKTVIHYLDLLTSFLRFHDIPYREALRKIKRPKKATVRVDRIPTVGELQKMILGSRSKRLSMLIQFLAQTGMRINEALSMKVEYIDFEEGLINVPGAITKSGKPRQIPLIRELETALQNYLKSMGIKEGYLFPSMKDPSKPWKVERAYADYRALLKRLGLDKRDSVGYMLHPHVLRKWFKTCLEMANVNRLLIMSWMGHDVGVQGVYFMPPPNEVKKEVEKAEKALQIFGGEHGLEESEKFERLEKLVEENKRYIEGVTEALMKVVKIISEEKPELLKKLEEYGIKYGRRSPFSLLVIEPDVLKRST